ncbi:hypothetical protein EUA93_09190 [Nocardioides oleivorans]|uniref:Uncharacterized protein n=1 Tax=Nocardioides oleivorans TaxID=273676 RepID=A0A4Q2RYX8_9ACTN|nr:hypothetical protein [Nocardioides oleivorans]RYB94501.1 hypothetical protein EUA93_09190 [Nocardioides oleivorans]
MPDPRRLEEVAAARARFRAGLAAAREELAAARSRPLLTEEEKRELTEVAARGDMGRDMQEFARDVRDGDADWESFVRRTDGRSELFREFVHRSEERFRDEVEEALVTSEPPPGVDDPRPSPWPPPGWVPPRS